MESSICGYVERSEGIPLNCLKVVQRNCSTSLRSARNGKRA
jgi:hypothetical protein